MALFFIKYVLKRDCFLSILIYINNYISIYVYTFSIREHTNVSAIIKHKAIIKLYTDKTSPNSLINLFSDTPIKITKHNFNKCQNNFCADNMQSKRLRNYFQIN